MDNPEKLETLAHKTQDEDKQYTNTTQHVPVSTMRTQTQKNPQ
jgi:hypothetical protein